MLFRRSIAAIVLMLAVAGPFAGQTPPTSPTPPAVKGGSHVPPAEEEKLKSSLMGGREMPYRVILPPGYSKNGDERYPVVYLLHGLTGHFDNWTELTRLTAYAQAYRMIIVTPEGGNGWYTDSPAAPNEKFESYIVKELMPAVEAKYRTSAVREKRAIAGLSMGGYGAMKFAFRYPERFALAGSFSGALKIASMTEQQFPGAVGRTIDGIFGPADSESRKANDIFGMARALTPERAKALPFLYLDCGTGDLFYQQNREFADLLIEKGVAHEYRQLPGAHNWKYWDAQVQEFLRVADRTFREGR